METVRAKLVRKASKSPVRGFVLEGYDGWFNANTPVIPDLAKVTIGTEIEVEYIQKGIFRNVSKITIVEAQKKATETSIPKCSVCGKELKNPKYPTCHECKDKVKNEPPKETTSAKPKCEVCGKELKDDKYKLCFMCNKKKAAEKPKEEPKIEDKPKTELAQEKPREQYNSGTKYGSAEDIAGKEVGCAANCAATILSGRQEQPETLLEMFRILHNAILEHIRASK